MKRTLSLSVGFLMLTAATAWPAKVADYEPKSDKPLRCQIQLGPGKAAKKMLVVFDESQGTGKGYDLAIADFDFDGSLADEKPVKKVEISTTLYTMFRIEAEAPFGKVDPKAKFNLALYVMRTASKGLTMQPTTLQPRPPQPLQPQLMAMCSLILNDGKPWEYLITGKALEPAKKDPDLTRFAFGAPVKLSLSAMLENGQLNVSLGLADAMGQKFRTNSSGSERILPHLKVTDPAGKVMVDKDLSYG